MKITMDVKDLIEELRKAFPDLDETKLKAAMLDLVLNHENIVTQIPVSEFMRPSPPQARSEAGLSHVRPDDDPVEEVGEEESVMGMTGMVGLAAPMASTWADVGKVARPVVTESAFDEDDATDEAPAPVVTSVGKKPRAARDNERKARQQSKDPFEGKSDIEIAQFLTAQTESKNKKKGGQFVDIGSDEGSGDMSIG